MMALTDLQQWLATLPFDSYIAGDDGGLTLVVADSHGDELGPSLEVGGIPES